MSQHYMKRILCGSWHKILGLSLLGMGASACGVFLALVSKRVVDVATGQAQGSLLRIGAVLGGVILLQLILQIVLTVLHVHTSASIRLRLQADLFARLLHKDKLAADRFHSGELVHRLSGDTAVAADGAAEILPSAAAVGARIVLSFCALLMLDPLLALLCAAAGVAMLAAARLYRKKTGSLFRESRESEGKIRSFIQEVAQNLAVIKAFSVYGVIQRQLNRLQQTSYTLTIRKNRISIGANVCFFVTMTAGYYTALAWGAWRIARGEMTFGTLTAVLGLTGDITAPFRQLAALFPQYMSVCASAERLAEFEGLPEDGLLPAAESEPLYQRMSAVRLDRVRFSYGADLVLDEVTCVFAKGTLNAVTGESGAGKSTLLNLLTGVLKPDSGMAVAVTAEGEAPLTSAYRSMFAYVPQEFLLLTGTVLENITLFEEAPDEERAWQAIRIAELEEEIRALPQGIQTFLGEGGGRLSGGQRQRMAIARAVYSRAEVLLMDESTSAVSAGTEERILGSLRGTGRTVVFVTHRKTAMNLCDCVFALRDGHIEEQF